MLDSVEAARLGQPENRESLLGRWRRTLAFNWTIRVGFSSVLLAIIAALFAPWLTPHDPLDQDLSVAYLPPAWVENGRSDYPLGTDYVGRDTLTRIIYGARVSLIVGIGGVTIASVLGIVSALLAGYLGGWVDIMFMRAVDVILSIPYILFVVFVVSVLGSSLLNVIIIFGIADFPLFTRLVRGEVLSLRESQFVEAAVCTGASRWRIIRTHLLPNIIGTVITMATFEMAAMVIWEASLGFLGLSVSPIIPSWGNMMAEGRAYLRTAWWLALFPGLAIMILALGINLTGDWLRFRLDPRSRGTR